MSGAAAAWGLRCAAANQETRAFYKTLNGFLSARLQLNEASRLCMPTNGAAAFDDVGGATVLRQHLAGAADMDAQLDSLYARAPAAKEALDAFCRGVFTDAGLDPDQEMIREAGQNGREDKVLYAYSAGPLKTRKRAAEKATSDYDGDAARLVDVVRGSIVCGDEASFVALLSRVLVDFGDEAGRVFVVRSKNRFLKPLFNGYRDVLVNLRLRLTGDKFMVVELQVHLVEILQFDAKTRAHYEYFRTYFHGSLVDVAERMEVLESIGGDGFATASLANAVERAVKARDASKLKALDDLLQKLAAYDLLAIVRECLLNMALVAHGEDSVEHSFALNSLASLLEDQGKFDAAEPLYRRAIAIYENRLGPDHTDVATSLGNLAGLLQKQGKLDVADPLFRRSLDIYEEQLEPDQLEVATSLNNLAWLLQAQGKLDDAEPLYRRALAIDEKQLGPDHPEVATSLGNLALVLHAQGKLDAAEPLFRRALAIDENELGPDHPDVATSLGNFAGLLQAQGKFDDAEPLYRRGLAIKEKQLGPDHPEVATLVHNLASLLEAQGNLDAAEPLYRRSLDIYEEQLGPDHPNVSMSLNNLALLLKAQGNLDAAEPLYLRALEIREKQLGVDHPDVATSLNNLASLLKAQGKLDAAEPLYRRALAIDEKQQLGSDHPGIATSLSGLATVLKAQSPVPLYRRTLVIGEKLLGPSHPSVATSLNNLAGLLKVQGKLDDAEPLYRRGLSIKEKQLGPDHPDVSTMLNNLALLLWRLGRPDEALPFQERATSIKERLGDAKAAEYRDELDQIRRGTKYPYSE